MAFFSGAIVCLGLSFTYHTVCCHQNRFIGGHIRANLTDKINATLLHCYLGKLFAKFDYCGIAFLTVGSFVPWLYYSFYCDYNTKALVMRGHLYIF